jgi:hypothetical protein
MTTLPNTGMAMAEVLEELSTTCLTLDAENRSADIRYSESDVMNVLLIFNHVVSNYVVHGMMDKPVEERVPGEMVPQFRKLSLWLKETTGINSLTYYTS